jgi:hypothetical protein
MKETDQLRQIMIATSAEIAHFRNNCGAWNRNPVCPHCQKRKTPGRGDEWIHYGIGGKGGTDLVSVVRGSGVAMFIEGKSATGRLSPEQERFLEGVQSIGAISCVARSAADVRAALNKPLA